MAKAEQRSPFAPAPLQGLRRYYGLLRPWRSGDLSRDGGKRAVMRALPGEAVVKHQRVIASTLPFPHQPSSGLQLRTGAYRGCSGFLELLCNPEELALRLRAEAAP